MKPVMFKKWHAVVLALLFVGVMVSYFSNRRLETTVIRVREKNLTVYVARTYKQQFTGWSNRDSMGPVDGMLFPFGLKGRQAMVMRDMRFPIDIVWLDNGVVVDIAPNAVPEPGVSEANLFLYRPRAEANVVIEFRAGLAQELGLSIGDRVEIAR
jgi:uncharacterized membrane protein (UPF0127 family)